MANDARTNFIITKTVVGGVRNDTAPTTTDGEAASLRLNSNSELIVSVGAGTTTPNHEEDTAHSSGDFGTQVLAVRNDTLATLVNADGDYAPLQVDANGALYVNIGGEAIDVDVEGTAAQDAAVTGNPMQMAYESADFDGAALPNAVDAEGDVVRPKASLSGVSYIMLVNEDGSATPLVSEGTAAGVGLQISLDNGATSTFAQGDASGHLRIVGPAAEDAPVVGDPLLLGGRYDSTPRDLDNGDVGAIALDADGNQIVAGSGTEDAPVVGTPILIGGRYDSTPRDLDNGDMGAVALDADGNVIIVGNVAHDSADLGNPNLIGFRARQTVDTAVAQDDRVRGTADLYGRQYVHSASHDTLSVTDNVTVGNGPETQFEGGTLANIVNATGTTYYYIDMSGFSKLGLQFVISSGSPTLTIEGTMEDNGTAAASCAYEDISSATFGAASWTANAALGDDAGKCGLFHFIRVKVVGTGTEDLEIFYKKMY